MPSPAVKSAIYSKPRQIRRVGFKSVAYAASPQSFTFAEPCSIGDQIVVGIVSYSATSTITSVACTAESNLTPIGSLLRPGAGVLSDGAIQLFYLPDPGVTVAGPKTITVTLSAATNLEAAGLILAGGLSTGFLDTSATASANSVSITTANAKEALVFIGLCQGAQTGLPPFTFDNMPHNLQQDGMHSLMNAGPAGTYLCAYSGTGNALIFAASFNAAP